MEQLAGLIKPVQLLVLLMFVAGSTELVKRIYKKDYEAAAIIVVAALVGMLGALAVGVAWYLGIVVGLGASGLVTIASKINGASA